MKYLLHLLIGSIIVLLIISFLLFNNSKKTETLPKIYLEGKLENLVTKEDIEIFKVRYQGNNANFNAYATIKIQGSSSQDYDKKNYNIKFYKDKNLVDKFKVDLGWGEQNKYCLKANWIDKTHSRNIVTANIFADMQKNYNLLKNTPNNGAIDGYPVEIYLNDEFWGLYTINIPKDEWLFNMDKHNDNNLVFSASISSNATFLHEKPNKIDWEVEIGNGTDENWLKFERMVNFVVNSSDKEFRENINDYFNFDSLLNYYILVEFAALTDNISKNTLFATYDGKIWYASLYDLDTSWGTTFTGKGLIDYSKMDIAISNNLWNKLKKNFANEIAKRYFQLKGNVLNEKYIMNKFYAFYNSIPESTLKKENSKWKNIPGYDLAQIEHFLRIRIPLLDKYFFKMYDNDTLLSRLYEQNYLSPNRLKTIELTNFILK